MKVYICNAIFLRYICNLCIKGVKLRKKFIFFVFYKHKVVSDKDENTCSYNIITKNWNFDISALSINRLTTHLYFTSNKLGYNIYIYQYNSNEIKQNRSYFFTALIFFPTKIMFSFNVKCVDGEFQIVRRTVKAIFCFQTAVNGGRLFELYFFMHDIFFLTIFWLILQSYGSP